MNVIDPKDTDILDAPGVVVRSDLVSNDGVGQIVRAEIDTQIATAKRYPRSITNFKRETLELACIDQATAKSMFYSVPRAGKTIVGPSIRMAEIVITTWGNLRVECRLVDYDDRSQVVTVEAACWDIERNSAVKVPKTRKVHGKKNKDGSRGKPDADMINLATNAALSVALRDAVFRIVPKAYINAAFEQAKVVALGKGKTIQEMRQTRVDTAKSMGVSVEQLCEVCDVVGLDDIGADEMIYIDGLFSSIKNGEASIEEVFPKEEKSSNSKVKEAIKKPEAMKEPPASEKPPEEKEVKKKKAEKPPVNEDAEPPPEEEQQQDDGEAPEWFEKRKGMYKDMTNVDRMRLPLVDLVKEWKAANDKDKVWWSALVCDAAEHLLGLCNKVSVVPLATKLLKESLKGFDDELIAEIVADFDKKQKELANPSKSE